MTGINKMEWDREAMKDEVLGYSDEILVNWSELGWRYETKKHQWAISTNCCQIAFEYLNKLWSNCFRIPKVGRC